VFISSVAVYGQETGLNINEKAPLNAKDFYGLSKIQAEEMVMNWCIKNKIICLSLYFYKLLNINKKKKKSNLTVYILLPYFIKVVSIKIIMEKFLL
jgi:UDP-glucose 4-epimerase